MTGAQARPRGDVHWLLNRLRCMSIPEIAWRGARALSVRVEQARQPAPVQTPMRCTPTPRVPPRLDEQQRCAIVGAADDIIAGRLEIFGVEYERFGFPPRWNCDPATGIAAPLAFGKRLDYRDEAKVGNIKTLWEPSRHLHLVTLAQAHALTREPRYADACRTLVQSWIEHCPYPLGVHWASSLELSIRLLNWSLAWDLLGGWDAAAFDGDSGARFRSAWLDSVHRHCRFVAGHLSLHSSANNHLLGEWMGLFIASLTWPCWPESSRWCRRAQAGFEAEALKQTAPDGVNREQALYYHHEVADMMLLVGLAGRAHGVPFSPAFWQRLEAMMDFLLAAMDRSGRLPMIGDADDALMVRLHGRGELDPYRSLLVSAAVLFERGDFKAAAGTFDDKSRWLLGDDGASAFDELPAAPPVPARRVFDDGGYALLGSRFGEADELRVFADSGPLGWLSIAAHGHADALAFTLSACGQELLIDPGTYAYHTEREWRDWFRGTPAHNTVTIDGEDQSEIGGNFMWLRKARAMLEQCSLAADRDIWQASHDGYRRLADPVLHRRRIEVLHARRRVIVDDTLECAGSHEAAIHWHAAETADVTLDGNDALIDAPGVRLRISLRGAGGPPLLLRGSTDPRGGWVSRRFGMKSPATQIVWSLAIAGTTQWSSEMQLEAT